MNRIKQSVACRCWFDEGRGARGSSVPASFAMTAKRITVLNDYMVEKGSEDKKPGLSKTHMRVE